MFNCVIIDTSNTHCSQVPPCPDCGGHLKPEIVFFGDNVAKDVVELVRERLAESDRVLLAGTSLHVSYTFEIILIGTFYFVYFVGRTIHKFKIPMKYLFTLVIICVIWNIREYVYYCQTMKFSALEIK